MAKTWGKRRTCRKGERRRKEGKDREEREGQVRGGETDSEARDEDLHEPRHFFLQLSILFLQKERKTSSVIVKL